MNPSMIPRQSALASSDGFEFELSALKNFMIFLSISSPRLKSFVNPERVAVQRWSISDSNRPPIDCEPIALPDELIPRIQKICLLLYII